MWGWGGGGGVRGGGGRREEGGGGGAAALTINVCVAPTRSVTSLGKCRVFKNPLDTIDSLATSLSFPTDS